MPNTPRVVTGANQDITGRTISLDYQAPAFATPLALSPTRQYTTVNVAALTGTMTITAATTLPYIGDQLEIHLTGDSVDRVVTFSTGFEGLANLTVTGSGRAVAIFRFNGTKWIYVSSATTSVSDVQTPAYAATLAVTFTARSTKLLPAQLTGAMTINATVTGLVAGDLVFFGAGADGTNRVITFGTGFKSSGTLTCTASKWVGASFIFDGTQLIAMGREITA